MLEEVEFESGASTGAIDAFMFDGGGVKSKWRRRSSYRRQLKGAGTNKGTCTLHALR